MSIRELMGSREIVETEEGRTGRRMFEVDWATRYEDTPQLGDEWPDDEQLKVVTRKFVPFGRPVGGGAYTEAKATITYSTADFLRLREGLEASVSYEVGAIGASWANYKDDDGNTVVNYQGIPLIMPRLVYTWESERTDLHPRTISNLMGKINGSSFKGYMRRTLLYMGASVEPRLTAAGEIVYRYRHRAMVKIDGWHRFPVPGEPDEVDELDPPPYEEESFWALA